MKEMSESGTHLLTFIPIVLHREEPSNEPACALKTFLGLGRRFKGL